MSMSAQGYVPDNSITLAKLVNNILANSTAGRAKMEDGFLSADAAGRAKMAALFLDSSKIAAAVNKIYAEARALARYDYAHVLGGSNQFVRTANKKLIFYASCDQNLLNLENLTLGAGTWLSGVVNAAAQPHGYTFYNSVPAQNDTFSQVFYCPAAGNYKLNYKYRKNIPNCIITSKIDGTPVDTTDSYAATSSENNVASITLSNLTEGNRTLSFHADTKNASSAGYYLQLYEILIEEA